MTAFEPLRNECVPIVHLLQYDMFFLDRLCFELARTPVRLGFRPQSPCELAAIREWQPRCSNLGRAYFGRLEEYIGTCRRGPP